MGKWVIFSVSGTGMEKKLFLFLSVRWFHLPEVEDSTVSPDTPFYPSFSRGRNALQVSLFTPLTPFLSLGVCSADLSFLPKPNAGGRLSILLSSCRHLAEQDCFMHFSGWTSVYACHGDICLSHEDMTVWILLGHVTPHYLQALCFSAFLKISLMASPSFQHGPSHLHVFSNSAQKLSLFFH